MKEEKTDIPSTCWNKYKELHADKIIYLKKIYNIFNDLSKLFSEFENKYQLLEIDSFINPIENNKINETIKLINKSIISFINLNGRMMKNILKTFQEINKLIIKEKDIYDKVLLLSKEYDERKQKIKETKNFFVDKMRIIEELFKTDIIDKTGLKLEKNRMEEALTLYNNYKTNVEEVNEKRKDFNQTQIELLNLYQTIIFEKEVDLYQNINSNFSIVQKNENDSTSINVDKMKDKKKINKKAYNKEIISIYHSKDKEEEEIEVNNYHLKFKPYPTNKDSTSEDIIKISQISDDLIKKMRKYIIDNFPGCNLQIQEASIELPEIINNFFDIQIELTENKKIEILKI